MYQTDHRDIFAIAIARTNIPLSSAHTWTLFHNPLIYRPQKLGRKCGRQATLRGNVSFLGYCDFVIEIKDT